MMPSRRAPLDILFVGTLPPHQGGSAISAYILLKQFVQLGHRIRAISFIKNGHKGGNDLSGKAQPFDITRLPIDEYYTKVYDANQLGGYDDDHPDLGKTIKRLVQDRRPDLIFIGRESFAAPVSTAAADYRLPMVLRTAGGKLCGIFYGNYPVAARQALFQALSRIDWIIAPARHLSESLRNAGFRHVEHIPNHVDLSRFKPGPVDLDLLSQHGITAGQPVILFAGNLSDRKRPEDLVYAAELVAQDEEVHFLIVAPESDTAGLKRLCEERGVLHCFHFAPWVSHEDMPRYFQSADMVVSTSWAEGLARVYIEAQACSALLIASDIPPAREVIEHDRTGLLFPLEDSGTLAKNILLGVQKTNLRKRMTKAALECVQTFDITRVAERYIESFEAVRARYSGN